METKHTIRYSLYKVVFIVTVLFFSPKTFCSDPNQTIKPMKTQPQKQNDTKSLSAKPIRPKVSPSSFRPDMPLREALDILSRSTNPPLNIVVKWKELDENANITPDTPIGMNGLTGVSLKTHLSILLMMLSTETAKLGFVIDGNIIIIGMKETLPKTLVTRTYDIADIVAPPSMGGMMGMGIGMAAGMGMTPYGNMSPYGTSGNQYGTGYNQGYMNQNYYQGYNQNNSPYGYQNTPGATAFGMMFGM